MKKICQNKQAEERSDPSLSGLNVRPSSANARHKTTNNKVDYGVCHNSDNKSDDCVKNRVFSGGNIARVST